MKIKITAPIKAGKIAKPPIEGPQLPNNDEPTQDPKNPTIMFPITPPGTSLPRIIPPIAPKIPPTIIDQINPNIVHSSNHLILLII